MSGEKTKTSAFAVYISEQEKKGVKREKAAEKWANMNKYQKDNYRKIAKELNEGIGEKRSIPASLQKSYMDRLIEKLLDEKSYSKAIVKDLVEDAYDVSKLDTTVFCILSISNFYEDKHDIYPCELALAKFSLKDGVIDSLGIFINPGALPTGATDEAIKHSQETHQYPIPKDSDVEDDYLKICFKVVEFLKSSFDEPPVFFTEGGYIDNRSTQKLLINTQRSLEKLFQKAGEYEAAMNLKVIPISLLFYYIHRCNLRDSNSPEDQTNESMSSTEEAHEQFNSNENYEYSTEGCEYHDEIDNKKNCCLSKVRRFGFKLAELCSQPHKYPLIEGKHYPVGYKLA